MALDIASTFLPMAPPQVIEGTYSEDQHSRLLAIARQAGPWQLILAQSFKAPEEVFATTTGSVPEGIDITWDMFLNPVFRGFLARDGVCLHPEIDDCFYNKKFLDLARGYARTQYVEPDMLMINLQGPTSAGGPPHVDGTHFRGMYANNAPIWLLNTMSKSGLFRRWQARKSQVIAWYYQGRIGGGFHYWPQGPQHSPQQLAAPMWGRGVVVENEMMFHTSQGCGPADQRKPAGLTIDSTISADPQTPGAWRIMDDDRVVQNIPEQEFRFLVHWNAMVYSDLAALSIARDHSDDITPDMAFDILIEDMKSRGEVFAIPTDPLRDIRFIKLLTRVYDIGEVRDVPADPVEETLVA